MIVLPAMPVRNRFVAQTYHRQLFSPQECDAILRSADAAKWESGKVGGYGKGGGFSEVREVRSNVQQPAPIGADGFPFNKILGEVSRVNSEAWMFQLFGLIFDDMPWLMRYPAAAEGHYDWHIDIGQGANASRKLAFSVQLTDGADYAGGNLEFYGLQMDPSQTRQRGTLIVFPAYWMHRVTPVTRGDRYALVGWVHGPSFT